MKVSDTVTRDTRRKKISGLVYVFTGEGKGKTSAALGVATRSLLLDKRVVWVAFYKQESWGLAEAKLRDKFENLEMVFSGKGFRIVNSANPSTRLGTSQRISKSANRLTSKSVKFAKLNGGGVVVDTASEEEHREAVVAGLQHAAYSLRQGPFLLVMDEVLNAVSEGLVESERVMEVLSQRGETHVVLTGRGEPSGSLPEGIVEMADLVTECKKIKHPYDVGKLAVAGLDF